jgi:3-oxoisoapionate decarboxylase
VTTPLVGVDSFSYHRWFGEHTPWETPLHVRRDAFDVLDLATGLDLDTVSLQTIHVDAEEMGTVAATAESRNLDLVLAWGHRSGLEGGTNPARLADAERWLLEAAKAGAPILRVVCGDQSWWRTDVSLRLEHLAPMLDRLAHRAAELGVALAIENHADLTIEDIVTLIERVGAPDIGICFDLGNAVRVGEDVVAAALLAAPYVRMVHAKDIRIQPESLGDPSAWWPTCPLGRGDLPVAEALRATLSSPHPPRWYVEMATMHPDHPDEDAAVSESVVFLRAIDWSSSAGESLDGE